MKKQLFTTIILCFLTVLVAKSQTVVNGCVVTMRESSGQDLSFRNDTLTVKFTPSDYFWRVKLDNNFKDEVTIVWDKSSFIVNGSASKIIFDNTIAINSSNAIADQPVPAESFIEKSIFPVEYFEVNLPTISKRFVNKRFKETGLPDKIKIILAIKVGNNLKNYSFNFDIKPEAKK